MVGIIIDRNKKVLVIFIALLTIYHLVRLCFSDYNVDEYHYIVYGSDLCPECIQLKRSLKELEVDFEYRPLNNETFLKEFLEIARILSLLTERNGTIHIPFVIAVTQDQKQIVFLASITNVEDLIRLIEAYEKTRKALFRDSQGNLLIIKEDVEESIIDIITGRKFLEEVRMKIGMKFLISLALSDSINPCTCIIYATFLALISTIYGDIRRVITHGLLFIMGIILGYLCLGVILFYTTLYIPRIIITLLGISFGVYSIITGVTKKPKLIAPKRTYRLLYKVTSIMMTLAISLLISFSLLPCSSGPYIIAIKVLTEIMKISKAILYLVIYNIVFVLPLFLILVMILVGCKVDKVRNVLIKCYTTLSVVAGIFLIMLSILYYIKST